MRALHAGRHGVVADVKHDAATGELRQRDAQHRHSRRLGAPRAVQLYRRRGRLGDSPSVQYLPVPHDVASYPTSYLTSSLTRGILPAVRSIAPAHRATLNGYRVCSFCRSRSCHAARPECRAMRKVQPQRRACGCSGGCHYPHRVASTVLCAHHPDHATAMWNELGKQRRKAS